MRIHGDTRYMVRGLKLLNGITSAKMFSNNRHGLQDKGIVQQSKELS